MPTNKKTRNAKSRNTTAKPTGDGIVRTLNVIFHGTFVFILTKENKIEVLIPKVPGHVYRAGNWLAEIELIGSGNGKRGIAVYKLEGATKGQKTKFLSEDDNLILKATKLKQGNNLKRLLHAKLIMDMPREITTPCRVIREPGKPGEFIVNRNDAKYKDSVGTMQVFTYDFVNEANLYLKSVPSGPGHYWEAAPIVSANGKVLTVNLHVQAEHDRSLDLSHRTIAFQKCLNLFQNHNIAAPPLGGQIKFNGQKLEGILDEEFEDLAPRMQRISQLGRMQKEKRDLNLLWFDSEALGTQLPACEGPGGC